MKNKILLFGLLLCFLQASANAQTEPTAPSTGTLGGSSGSMPEECGNEGFTFQNGQLILGTQNSPLNPQLYMFHNNSDYEQLLISHPTNTAMSTESRLDQGQWSAFAVNQPNFVINCFGRKPGAIGYVDCKSVLQVCSYPKASMGGGNHWVAENKSLFDTISSLPTKNVTLPK